MKRLMFVLSLALVSLAFTRNTFKDNNYGLVGEWVTNSKGTAATHVRFFENGLMNIQKGDRNIVANYKYSNILILMVLNLKAVLLLPPVPQCLLLQTLKIKARCYLKLMTVIPLRLII